ALQDRVRFLGHAPDGFLPSLYAAADLFLFPSLYEGFGIPVLESMAAGTPVITSTAPSLPEVGGGAALTVEPTDDNALAQAIARVLTDGKLRDRLVQAGSERVRHYGWRKSAEKLLEALRSLSK
ncbi:MAG: glycosyltransferase family 4 protein, partial [Elusimicrobia bacterium]|nr:glycosyltransferase family 4 protein [Elusimicrobiota bacterium]